MCVIEPSPVVETRRLVLRSPGAQDIPRLASFANDPEIARMTLRMPHPYGEAEARAFCAVIASKSRKALVIAKEALNGLEPRDVDRGYRWEQGFTLEMYMHEDSQKARDEFVETGKAAKF